VNEPEVFVLADRTLNAVVARIRDSSDPSAVLAAADAYRIPTAATAGRLEADLRSTQSQPGAALHAGSRRARSRNAGGGVARNSRQATALSPPGGVGRPYFFAASK
jgi:hypothetical protein